MSDDIRQRFGTAIGEAAGDIAQVYQLKALHALNIAARIQQALAPLIDAAARDAEIVARLPRTADGVPVTPGQIVYCEGDSYMVMHGLSDGYDHVPPDSWTADEVVLDETDGSYRRVHASGVDVDVCYSTRQRSLAASKEGK